MIDLAALSAPFPPDRVSWRVGSTNADKSKGMALAYIDARDVYDRLDAVCGPANWQCRYSHADKKTVCEIGIKVGDEWIWKANGAGDSDVEAEKGAMSDAVKRAAVVWGIGRYLYDIDSPWVKITQRGRSYAIDEGEFAKLRGLLGRAAAAPVSAPAAAQPRPPANGVGPADKLMMVLNSATDAKDLADIKADPDFRAKYSALDPEERERVIEHGKKVAARFQQPILMAG